MVCSGNHVETCYLDCRRRELKRGDGVSEDRGQKEVKAIICLGPGNEAIHETFSDLELPIADTYTMAEAVEAAYYLG